MPAIMCIWQAPRQVRNTGQQHNLLIIPTLQRGNGILTLPRQRVQKTVRPEDAIPDHGQAITCIPRCCAG